MSLHPSLKASKSAQGDLKNVMKRYERVRLLMEQGKWPEGRSVLGLPKIKRVKIKSAKKAAGKEKAEAATAEKPAAGATASS